MQTRILRIVVTPPTDDVLTTDLCHASPPHFQVAEATPMLEGLRNDESCFDDRDKTQRQAQDTSSIGSSSSSSSSSSADRAGHFLLNLDFDNHTPFSIESILSEIESSGSSNFTLLGDIQTERHPSAGGQPSERSPFEDDSEYVVVTEEMLGTHQDRDLSTDSVTYRPARIAQNQLYHASWRHAMYVSSLVWPAGTRANGERLNTRRGDKRRRGVSTIKRVLTLGLSA
ncbi:hypothetical protein A0H81_14921 [Grifola frondosa]|uniref:Uncharacterized protein n=1 Tax=Grifola frondosa TaxID=5627 RepID=A0A1C7LKJ0_GRIFR|nr:hypothetical protein A0H81_14921 [Grifola frondosa]